MQTKSLSWSKSSGPLKLERSLVGNLCTVVQVHYYLFGSRLTAANQEVDQLLTNGATAGRRIERLLYGLIMQAAGGAEGSLPVVLKKPRYKSPVPAAVTQT